MADIRDRIRADEHSFQKLLEDIPGFDGYREREIRRTADKLLRERLVADLDVVRDALKDIVARWAEAGKLGQLDAIDRLSRRLDKARDSIRFADYGYTGFFDAVKINEDNLDRLYDYDLALRKQITDCAEAVRRVAEEADDPSAALAALEAAIAELQSKVDRREEVVAAVVQDTGSAS